MDLINELADLKSRRLHLEAKAQAEATAAAAAASKAARSQPASVALRKLVVEQRLNFVAQGHKDNKRINNAKMDGDLLKIIDDKIEAGEVLPALP